MVPELSAKFAPYLYRAMQGEQIYVLEIEEPAARTSIDVKSPD